VTDEGRIVERSTGSAWEAYGPGRTFPIAFEWDGQGSAVTAGATSVVIAEVPVACLITAARITAPLGSGSAVVDLWVDSYANYPPTVADTITASAKPTLSSAQKAEDTTLTGWSPTLAAGDYIAGIVDSADVTRLRVDLTCVLL
jgi:hypothetical protein